MKPGWKTTEFWTTMFAQALALLAFVGVLTPSERQTLGEALGKAVAAVFTLFVNGAVVIHYVQGRVTLKSPAARETGTTLPLWIAVILLPLLLASSAHASPGACGVEAAEGVTQRTALLPWRARIEQQLQELQRRQAQPAPSAPAPSAPAPIIVQPPLQQLPVPGDPRQMLPVPGDPRQQLPVPGEPRQPLPVPGAPLQPVPIFGNPLQPLPVMPPAASSPQSYTIFRALSRPIP